MPFANERLVFSRCIQSPIGDKSNDCSMIVASRQADDLTSVCDTLEEAIRYTRSLNFQLNPSILHGLGLVTALEKSSCAQESSVVLNQFRYGRNLPCSET